MGIISCPVCKNELSEQENRFCCLNNHCFDKSSDGYVNLLSGGHRSGALMGDSREMARSRKEFLNKGYFSALADALCDVAARENIKGNVLDVCCGEGYYTEYLSKRLSDCCFYSFDLSREMVRLCAKRKIGSLSFVANISQIPIADNSIDFAIHLFAPFHKNEFYRIMKDEGLFVTVIPGENHLMGLKSVLYDTPYKNDEEIPDTGAFRVVDKIKASSEIKLCGDDIMSLFRMTPYFYHTPAKSIAKLEAVKELETEIQFVLVLLKK